MVSFSQGHDANTNSSPGTPKRPERQSGLRRLHFALPNAHPIPPQAAPSQNH